MTEKLPPWNGCLVIYHRLLTNDKANIAETFLPKGPEMQKNRPPFHVQLMYTNFKQSTFRILKQIKMKRHVINAKVCEQFHDF